MEANNQNNQTERISDQYVANYRLHGDLALNLKLNMNSRHYNCSDAETVIYALNAYLDINLKAYSQHLLTRDIDAAYDTFNNLSNAHHLLQSLTLDLVSVAEKNYWNSYNEEQYSNETRLEADKRKDQFKQDMLAMNDEDEQH